MASPRQKGTWLLVLIDLLTAAFAWTLFFIYRKIYFENPDFEWIQLQDGNFQKGVTLIPLFWLILYIFWDSYKDMYRQSRMNALIRTFFQAAVGTVLLFFILLVDDTINGYQTYRISVVVLFTLYFVLTFVGRFFVLTWASRRLKSGKVGFNTLIIGGNQVALDLFHEISGQEKSLGYRFKGFIDINGNQPDVLSSVLPRLGEIEQIAQLVKEHDIEEVIIAVDPSGHAKMRQILDQLFEFDLVIKVIPDMYDIMLGSVKMNHVYGAILIEIYPELMPLWQRIVKRMIDLAAALTMILLLWPIMLYAMIRVKLSSKGPIFYKQVRIGINGKPFEIIKFRSMTTDAEKHGPALSQGNDSRITAWGMIMRKWRIDELPQCWNVLRGDMSLVGPRPERQFYIDQIVAKAPHYKQLLKVRPGITSWGQVKYGYASNVDEMVERLKYDILYIENMSLSLDFKIILYTFLIIFQGRGK